MNYKDELTLEQQREILYDALECEDLTEEETELIIESINIREMEEILIKLGI
jgi:hypothetical protein